MPGKINSLCINIIFINLEKLLEIPKKKVLVLITVFSFIAFILLTLVMLPTELYLKGNTGYGVFEFEFAWTAERINQIFRAWGSDGKQRQALVTYIDFFYIPYFSF